MKTITSTEFKAELDAMVERAESLASSSSPAPCCALDVWDSLLVRACKSNRVSIRRFRKIWARRCALYYDHTDISDVIEHLIEMIDRLRLEPLTRFMRLFNRNLQSREASLRAKAGDAEEALLETVVQIIQHTAAADFPGLRSPTKFSRRHNAEHSLPLAATPLFTPSKRQTGRTTRMIEHAHALAGQGKAVYIIAVNEHDAERIRKLVGTPNRGIKVETEQSLPNFDWRTMHLKGAWPNCVVLVDHYAIEGRIRAQVEMMTRYDLGANEQAHRQPWAETINEGTDS